MSMAIAYAMHKKKMAQGGSMPCAAHGADMCKMCHGGEYAKGGEVDHEKGVHKASNESVPGRSEAGNTYRLGQAKIASDYSHKADDMGRKYKKDAIKQHKDKLLEMQMMKKPNLYAEGGFVEEETESGYEPHHEEHQSHEDEDDLVGRIMRQRSEGEGEHPDMEPNEFDDMAKDEHLGEEANYTGANSGDELGNEHLDEDEDDIIERIMKQRRMKDKNPSPA